MGEATAGDGAIQMTWWWSEEDGAWVPSECEIQSQCQQWQHEWTREQEAHHRLWWLRRDDKGNITVGRRSGEPYLIPGTEHHYPAG